MASGEVLPAVRAPSALVASTAGDGALTKAQILANRALLLDVMGSSMRRDQHYGVIPGTPKPTLFKAGAELLLMLFRIDGQPSVEDLSTSDCIRYRVTLRGVHAPTGFTVGHGVGEASTDEEKYRWKKTRSRREFDDTPEDRRRIKYGWDSEDRREYEILQVRTNPADVANTILKMAKKRAQVDLALTCTAASDVFTQDLEDFEDQLASSVTPNDVIDQAPEEPQPEPQRQSRREERPRTNGKPATEASRSRGSGGGGKCTERQALMIGKKLDTAGIPENEFFEKFGIQAIADLPFGKVDEALRWIDSTNAG
jgi:hypothetical protein